jgi:hypothetical protein
MAINLMSADYNICKILVGESVKPTGWHQGIFSADCEKTEGNVSTAATEPLCKVPWERIVVFLNGQVSCCGNMVHEIDSRGITKGNLGDLKNHDLMR